MHGYEVELKSERINEKKKQKKHRSQGHLEFKTKTTFIRRRNQFKWNWTVFEMRFNRLKKKNKFYRPWHWHIIPDFSTYYFCFGFANQRMLLFEFHSTGIWYCYLFVGRNSFIIPAFVIISIRRTLLSYNELFLEITKQIVFSSHHFDNNLHASKISILSICQAE